MCPFRLETSSGAPCREELSPFSNVQVQDRYESERTKRLRPQGISQYVDLFSSERFKHYGEDMWLDPERPYSDTARRFGNSRCKVLILGAGYGGLLHAVNLIRAGMSADDLCIVDSAGGFGGTWYWNRYPGLMCDIESYIYMPLLEQTGYMPKHKYASGIELREYAELLADKWKLREHTLLQTQIKQAVWDDLGEEWVIDMSEIRKGDHQLDFEIRAQFFICASGVLSHPQVLDIPGMGAFKGQSFHNARWDYHCTGGSPSDPSLIKLKDKKVAIVGTGATAVQVIPHLAQWAGHLYVFQRTPSAVVERGQQSTDPEWWARMTKESGWQRKRNANFNAHMCNAVLPGDEDLVDDGWSNCPSWSARLGDPYAPADAEGMVSYLERLQTLDSPRMDRIRARVDQIIKHRMTAESLKPWYPSWCRRPCFHDDYLPIFNQANVTLVDTDGQGIDGVSASGILFQGQEYEVDILIFSTGYRSAALGNVANRARLSIRGCGGKTTDAVWADGISTLHGVISRDFPNFFFLGPAQTAAAANYSFFLDQVSQHIAYIITQSMRIAGSERVILEPTEEAIQAWSEQISSRAIALTARGSSTCAPRYHVSEGKKSSSELLRRNRTGLWGHGIESYLEYLAEWRAKGDLTGLNISQLDQWRDEGHAFQLVLIWDHDRIWGSFDFGSYKGILKIDKGPERAPPHEDGVSEYVQTYHHFTWRGTCTQSPKSIINNPVFTKGKIELESDGISGYFLGMPNIGLPGGRCDFEGLPVWGPRRVARKLESFIEDWNALKIIQLDEAPRPQPDSMVTL